MSALTNILDKLDGVKQRGDQYAARCPASTHGGEDRNPSLSVKEGDDGRVLVTCFAGCPFEAIADGLGLTARDFAPETPQENPRGRGEWTPFGEAVAVYDYRDEEGNLLFQVLRTADKQFPQRKPDPTAKSGYVWKLGDTRRVPYRLPQLIAAVAEGKTVGICEGEKDVHNLERVGMAATCNPGGAGKWLPTFAQFFEGATVVICADKDKPGQAHARTVAEALEGIAARITVVEAADPHKDVSDHLNAGLPLSAMVTTSGSQEPVQTPLAEGINDFLDGEDEPYDWLVPNLLERRDRLILTGSEGLGKTTLGRQLAICLAAGIHPFTFEHIEPCKVLLIDCENTRMQNRRRYRPLRDHAAKTGRPVSNDSLRIILRNDGLDLTKREDTAWLHERVRAHKPDVLFIGPIYKLHYADPNAELPARSLIAAIDGAREIADCAVIMEAHSGHGVHGDRSVRPIGASIYLRWPEFGYGLAPMPETKKGTPVAFKAWRGPRDERDWPEYLRYGHDGWPWVTHYNEADYV